MCQVAAYIRVSTKEQTKKFGIERQKKNILSIYPDAKIFEEAYTGTKIEGRKVWERLYNLAISGKVKKIVFDSVSRMSRNAEEGFTVYKTLFDIGVELEFIKEPHINTSVYKENLEKQIKAVKTGDKDTDELMETLIGGINQYMMRLAEQQIKIAFQQSSKEVEDLRQRIQEGIALARAEGKQVGAVPGKRLQVKKAAAAKELIKKHAKTFGGTLKDKECIKLIGIAPNTYYKYKKELLEEIDNV